MQNITSKKLTWTISLASYSTVNNVFEFFFLKRTVFYWQFLPLPVIISEYVTHCQIGDTVNYV